MIGVKAKPVAATEVSVVKDVPFLKKALILIGFCTAQLLDITTTHIGLSLSLIHI